MLNVSVTYESNPPMTVLLLDCDTISQAKEKMLDVIFKVPKNHSAIIINHFPSVNSHGINNSDSLVSFENEVRRRT